MLQGRGAGDPRAVFLRSGAIKDNLEDWLKGKGLRKRLFYGVGFARTQARDESKRANTVRPYGGVCVSRGMGYIKKTGEHSSPLRNAKENFHNPKNIPTTQKKIPRVHRRARGESRNS